MTFQIMYNLLSKILLAKEFNFTTNMKWLTYK